MLPQNLTLKPCGRQEKLGFSDGAKSAGAKPAVRWVVDLGCGFDRLTPVTLRVWCMLASPSS